MEIKSTGNHPNLIRFFNTLLIIFVLLIYRQYNIFFLCVYLLILIIAIIQALISYRRTLIMDEEGCTIKFLWFTHKYKWTELETKRIEDYTNALRYMEPYGKGVIFYKKRVRKPKWILPSHYNIFIHPFSFFFVYFDPHIDSRIIKKKRAKQALYCVEESEFLKQMAEWGVELEDTRK